MRVNRILLFNLATGTMVLGLEWLVRKYMTVNQYRRKWISAGAKPMGAYARRDFLDFDAHISRSSLYCLLSHSFIICTRKLDASHYLL